VPTRPVYLDNHASTRADPRVVAAMLPYFTESYGNASAVGHRFGWEAAEAVERAREQVAELLGVADREVIFTSGATESNNLALKGVAPGLARKGRHLVTTAVEHKSVLDPLKRLAREGWDLTVVPPDGHGLVSAESIAAALTVGTVLVSVIAASNEVGTINPLAEIGRLCRARGIVFHTDATQAVGKIPFDARELGADLVSLSGHKFYGPKGVGALVVRRGGNPALRLTPLFEGGGQERGSRSGTVAVPLAVGLGEASAIALRERDEEARRVLELRERLHEGIRAGVPDVRLNGHPSQRLPGNLNLSFAGVEGEALVAAMTEVAVSAGAACSSANPEPSHVLRAIGLDEAAARASLRLGLGRFTTAEEVDFAANFIARTVNRLRSQTGEPVAEALRAI
jgi:cysteine desulfurase